jgi:hypothetical protein
VTNHEPFTRIRKLRGRRLRVVNTYLPTFSAIPSGASSSVPTEKVSETPTGTGSHRLRLWCFLPLHGVRSFGF